MKVTKDNFVWLIVTDKARKVFNTGLFELYILFDDDTERLIENLDDIDFAFKYKCDIGIEVGHLKIVTDVHTRRN